MIFNIKRPAYWLNTLRRILLTRSKGFSIDRDSIVYKQNSELSISESNFLLSMIPFQESGLVSFNSDFIKEENIYLRNGISYVMSGALEGVKPYLKDIILFPLQNISFEAEVIENSAEEHAQFQTITLCRTDSEKGEVEIKSLLNDQSKKLKSALIQIRSKIEDEILELVS